MGARLLMLAGIAFTFCGCATPPPPAPVTDACAWLKQIIPGVGFETRWTRDEKAQVLAFDQMVAKQCRPPNV